MSEAPADFPALASLPTPHAVVLNLGTLTTELLTAYHAALAEYNKAVWPVILDPVAAGATEFRKAAVAECLERGYADVIKGNLGEVMAVAGWEGGKSRGVDSIDTGSLDDRCRLAKFLAQRERNSPRLCVWVDLGCVVVVTGKDDVVSDGNFTVVVSNGDALLGKITGVSGRFGRGG
jgi:thiamine-phosphate diphosphorylase / hydroxyethylthiazole kinase